MKTRRVPCNLLHRESPDQGDQAHGSCIPWYYRPRTIAWYDGTPRHSLRANPTNKFSCSAVTTLAVDLAEIFNLIRVIPGSKGMVQFWLTIAQTVTFGKSKESYTIRLPSYMQSMIPMVVRPIAVYNCTDTYVQLLRVFQCIVTMHRPC